MFLAHSVTFFFSFNIPHILAFLLKSRDLEKTTVKFGALGKADNFQGICVVLNHPLKEEEPFYLWLWAVTALFDYELSRKKSEVSFYDRQKPPWPGDPRQVRGRKLETQESRCSLHCTGEGNFYFYLFKNHYKFTNQYLSLSLWGNNFHIIFPSFFLSLKSPFKLYSPSFLIGLPQKGPKGTLKARWYPAISGKPYKALWTSSGCLG